jgi:hypothetical protein
MSDLALRVAGLSKRYRKDIVNFGLRIAHATEAIDASLTIHCPSL